MHICTVQGAASCYFNEVGSGEGGEVRQAGGKDTRSHAALPTLLALERTIQDRRAASEADPGAVPSAAPAPRRPHTPRLAPPRPAPLSPSSSPGHPCLAG